jgi:hypothetical protein
MLEVTVLRNDQKGNNEKGRVQLYGFNTLTPQAARAALEIAGFFTGTVIYTSTDKSGENTYRKAYRVYPNSARKIFDDVL